MDTRPQIERSMHRALVASVALIVVSTVLGGAAGLAAASRFTRLKES